MIQNLNINDIMLAGVPTKESSKIRVSFKKTVQVRDYESEVIEMSAELDTPDGTTSAQRAAYEALMYSQLRYIGYLQLLFRSRVTQGEFDAEITAITNSCAAMLNKLESVSGEDLSSIFSTDVLKNATVSQNTATVDTSDDAPVIPTQAPVVQ